VANREASPWTKFRALFRWETSEIDLSDDGSTQSPDDEINEVSNKAWMKANEVWNGIAELTIRGNAAGVIASLTMFGSQSLKDKTPRVMLFWTIVLFLLGLCAPLFQRLIKLKIINNEEIVKKKLVFNFDEYSVPPHIFEVLLRFFDWLAVTALISGVAAGLFVLFSMTYLK